MFFLGDGRWLALFQAMPCPKFAQSTKMQHFTWMSSLLYLILIHSNPHWSKKAVVKKRKWRKKNMFCIVLFDTIWLGNVGACTWRRPRREVVWSATRCCCSGCKIPTFSRSPRYIKHHRANIHTLLTHTKPIHISYLFTIVIKDPTQKQIII